MEWFAWLGMAYFIAPALIVVYVAPSYETIYEGLTAEPPALTVWSLERYHYTLSFLLVVAPLLVLARGKKSEKALQVSLVVICIILMFAYALWLLVMWYGIVHPMNVLNSVVQ